MGSRSQNRPQISDFSYFPLKMATRGLFWLLEPTYDPFSWIVAWEFALRYVGGVLELRKLDFRGLKGQFDVKKANFRGLIAKIGHYRPILASKTHPWPIF